MIRREVKIGAMVVVAIVILIWGFSFLKGRNLFVIGSQYYGVYSRVDGLNEGSPVFYKGFRVGSVQGIGFHPEKQGMFLVSFNLRQDVPLYERTIAQIYSVDLLGSKAVQLIDDGGDIRLIPGDTLRTNVMGDLKDQVSMEVLPLKDKTEKLLVKLDTVLTNIGRVFSEENKKGLSYAIRDFYLTMENLEHTTRTINHALASDGDIGKSLQNIEQFTAALKGQSANLNTSMSNLTLFTQNLKDADISRMTLQIDSMITSLNHMINKATEGSGSLGMLVNDPALYLNLMDATANLDRLMADMRHNPERYLHFSAINLGRRVYINADEQLASEKGIVFKVKVAESTEPLDIRNTVVFDDMPVIEDTDGQRFVYTVGETPSYGEALKLKDRLQPVFPTASIISLQQGRQIPIKRALRRVNIKN